jgi:hypothetical protein
MRNRLCAGGIALFVMLAAQPAIACMMNAGFNPEDIKYASVVVIGRITNYEIVRPKKDYALSDYARFKVLVDEVLVGQPPKVISVTWDNSTFGEPEKMAEGPYLIGLRDPGAKRPPLRGPSATVLPSPEPEALTVLQAPCAPAFIIKATSDSAKKIREILNGSPDDREGD